MDAVETMSDAAVLCRDYGHSWVPRSARWDDESQCYDTQADCSRCRKAHRLRWLDARGAVVASRYVYDEATDEDPRGYLVHGLGRLTGADRDVIRLASVTRTIRTPAARLAR